MKGGLKPGSGGPAVDAPFRFFRQWLREPRAIAAVAPSGQRLAAHMAAAIGDGARTVVELGAGTGVMTQALLARGIARDRLVVLERNPDLHAHLVARFPGVRVALADATDLADVLRAADGPAAGAVDAVVSSLGLLSIPREQLRRVLRATFAVLRPTGRLVQFTYLPRCPVPRALLRELGLVARRDSWSLLNLPPAFVYVLQRQGAA